MENPASVLIVENSATMSAVLRSMISATGCTVLGELTTGKNVLATVADKQPDILYLSYQLPDADGLELLKVIRSEHPTISVVMIASNTDSSIEKTAAELGAAAFIRKPFTEHKIASLLNQIVQARQFLATAKNTPAPADQKYRATAIIAEDSSTMRAMLSEILSSRGIKVLGEASNGEEAVQLAVEHKPDIACLDIEMPAMNGLEAMQLIREKCPSTKVVIITANASKESVVQASVGGAAGFIVKPLVPDKVGAVLEKLLPQKK